MMCVWADLIMEQYIKLMNEDDDKDTVCQVCTSTAEILKSLSYNSIQQCKFWELYFRSFLGIFSRYSVIPVPLK